MTRVRAKDTGISGGSPIARGNRARQRALANQCPQCHRKSALSTVVNPGTVSRVCRWCDYDDTTVTTP